MSQLKLWGTLGAFDEQNIESAHAFFNALLRRFGSTRGMMKQEMVLHAVLFNTSADVNARVATIKAKIKRKGNASARRRREATTVDNANDCIIEVFESGELDEVHVKINDEVAFHPHLSGLANGEEIEPVAVESEATKVVVCPHCDKLLLQMALKIHCTEVHNKNISLNN